MSYAAFGEYLDVLRARADDAIDWSVVRREQIEARGHAERRGLQIVDAVARGYWYGLNRNRFGHTEDRYARILHPLAYKRNGRCRSYGLKFFPPEVEALMKKDPGCAWVRELRIQDCVGDLNCGYAKGADPGLQTPFRAAVPPDDLE